MTADEGWLAGIIEAEGCIDLTKQSRDTNNKRLRIRIKMVDEDIVARVAELLGVSYWARKHDPNQRQYEVEIKGQRAVELAQRLMPMFGQRRQAKLKSCIEIISAHSTVATRRR